MLYLNIFVWFVIEFKTYGKQLYELYIYFLSLALALSAARARSFSIFQLDDVIVCYALIGRIE